MNPEASATHAGEINRLHEVVLRCTGFGDWWKVNALLYILRHPARSYRTRDLQAHLNTAS